MIPNYPKFREWLTLKGYSAASVQSILRQADSFLQWAAQENIAEPAMIGYNDVMAYVKSCSIRGVSQKTIAHYLTDVRKWYDFLISEGIAAENPVTFIKLRGIKRKTYYTILTPQELQQLYRQYPVVISYEPGKIIPPQEQNILSRRRNKVILSLLVNQGLRVEEIKALGLQDLHLREGQVTIHSQRRIAQRILPLETYQVYELMDYLSDTRKQLLQVYGAATDKLFIQRSHTINFYGITAQLLKHLRKINPSVKNLEQIRASVITHWVKIHDLRKAQYMAGHRYVGSTEDYKQQVLDELQGDVKKFHPF
jgi:site-specific recombinase XerD